MCCRGAPPALCCSSTSSQQTVNLGPLLFQLCVCVEVRSCVLSADLRLCCVLCAVCCVLCVVCPSLTQTLLKQAHKICSQMFVWCKSEQIRRCSRTLAALFARLGANMFNVLVCRYLFSCCGASFTYRETQRESRAAAGAQGAQGQAGIDQAAQLISWSMAVIGQGFDYLGFFLLFKYSKIFLLTWFHLDDSQRPERNKTTRYY